MSTVEKMRKARSKGREKWKNGSETKRRKPWRVKACVRRKLHGLAKRWARAVKRSPAPRRGASALRVCTARPYFNREIRTKRGKEGYTEGYTRCEGGQEDGEKKRRRRCARKKLESRNSKDTEGKYKARYASQAAVILGGAGRSERKSYHSSLRLFSALSLSLSENDFSFALREDGKR